MADNPLVKKSAVLIYCLKNLIDISTRYYDIVAGGFFKYLTHDLPLINSVINDEFEKRLMEFNKESASGDQIQWETPYKIFDINQICNSWFSKFRPKIQILKFKIETTVTEYGQSSLPPDFIIFSSKLDKMITDYEIARTKHDATTFSQIIKEKEAVDESFSTIDFSFVSDANVRLTIQSYFEELRITYSTETVRAPIILSGAIIEALLLEALKATPDRAIDEYEKTKGKNDKNIETWTFNDAVEVSLKIGLLPTDLGNQLDAVRNFRNFVHINKALKSGLLLDKHFKEICKSALFIVINHTRTWINKVKK